jgi:hypothetical protein
MGFGEQYRYQEYLHTPPKVHRPLWLKAMNVSYQSPQILVNFTGQSQGYSNDFVK